MLRPVAACGRPPDEIVECVVMRAVFLLSLLLACGTAVAAGRPPNVVVIMADDLGWGDLSCYGATAVKTPHCDRLAREGRRFTSGYCSASTCTPTRYSLLTGEYAFRLRGTGIAPPNGPAIIQPGTPTCASVLRQAGYATAVVGKWHLGLGEPGRGPDWNGVLAPGPLEIGFDHCFILPTTNDRVPSVFVEDHRVRGLDPADPLRVGDARPSPDTQSGADRRPRLQMESSKGHDDSVHNGIGRVGVCTGGARARFRDEDLADAWARESVRWIEAHAERPFFLFLAPHDIHVPRVPHERFRGATAMGPRGDCIVEFDWTVGQVLAALERLGIANDTLVILTSDNGPVLDDGYRDDAVEKLGDHRPAGPFRGGKYSVFEGGTRTPFIARWPGRIAPGVSDEIVCTIDLGRSVAAVVGAGVPAGAFPDAVDVSAALLGTGAGRRSLLLQDNGGSGRFGFRRGAWKLVREPVGVKRKGDGPRPVHDALYDLEGDPGETTDVGGGHPDVVRRLADEVDAITKPPPRRAGFRDGAAGSPGGAAPAKDALFEAFRTPGNDGKPFSYWWWKGNDVTRPEISRQLDLLHRAGIAGVHIVPLGKPAGDLDWLSPEWWRLVRHAVDEAERRGMQVDINAGYGWPSGGTFVPAEHRLQAISCVIEKVRGPASFERRIEDFLPANQAGLRSFAFVRLVPPRIDRLSEVVDLGGHVHDGLLEFTVPPGEHFLYVGIHRLHARPNKVTGKADDHALDYFDQVGVRKYLGHFADSLHGAVGARLGDLFHAFFVSSVEIWPANWTTGFADEFRRRRGYDPMPYAPFVTGMYPIPLREAKHPRPDPFTASPECADEIRRARYDYNRTLVELFRENFVETTQRWCREQGVLFRYQAYGFPWNIGIGENYLVPDIPEGNNWVLGEDPERGWEVWNKYAAAGGHLTGKRVISNEAMTTQKGMFRETLDLVKRADDFNFITGNTRSVIHGFCYSPADAAPPGRHQYGTFLSEHNPWWPYFPRWTAYNARLSQVLQLADPVIDVAILGPTADVWSDDGLNRVALQTTPRYCYRLWESLSQQGVSADYLHEEVLQRAAFDGGRVNYGPMGYRLLILCDVASLEPATAEAILRYVQAGGRLVIVGRGPERSPGLNDAAANDRRVRASLEAAVETGGNRVTRVAAPSEAADLLAWTGGLLDRTRMARRVEFARPAETLFQVHSRAGGRDIFFLCNQDTGRRVATAARFEAVAGTPWRWDPETGDRAVYPRAEDGRLAIDLGPAESLLLVFEPDSPTGPVYEPAPVAGGVVKPIEEPWNLRLRSFRREESTLAAQPLEDFARIEALRDFAGTVDYETSFVVTTADVAAARVLDLGRVNGVSEAWLNGRSLGARWYGGHHYPVSDVLQSGANTLRVRVATLVWNGVAGPDAPRESAGLPGPVVLRSGRPH